MILSLYYRLPLDKGIYLQLKQLGVHKKCYIRETKQVLVLLMNRKKSEKPKIISCIFAGFAFFLLFKFRVFIWKTSAWPFLVLIWLLFLEIYYHSYFCETIPLSDNFPGTGPGIPG